VCGFHLKKGDMQMEYPIRAYGPFIQYKHHGAEVWVQKGLKGLHRDHCLIEY